MLSTAVDILVDTQNPEGFDRTVQQFGAALVGGPTNFVTHEGYYVMRVFGNPGLVEHMVTQQGYGIIVRRLDHLI